MTNSWTNSCSGYGLDHLELFVGNAKQASRYYCTHFGFANVAHKGLETGERHVASYLLTQGDIRLVLSSALHPEHPIAENLRQNGDTLAVIAFTVPDVAVAYAQALHRGVNSAFPPTQWQDQFGVFTCAAVHTFGNVTLKFVDRSDYRGNFAPGFANRHLGPTTPMQLKSIDHIVGNVDCGQMDHWIDILIDAIGAKLYAHFDGHTIRTQHSSLSSKVLQSPFGTVININEPAPGACKSQIQEFLDYHQSPGIQHIALATDDIVHSVRQMRQSGVEFLPITPDYYSERVELARDLGIPLGEIAELGILFDGNQDGHLLQIFTKPLSDRPTLFFEIIQRNGFNGFGVGNFNALFAALECEQALRGNLSETA